MAVLAWVCVALGMRSSSAANAIETADGAPSITPSEQIRDVGGWRSYERYDGYSGNLRLSFHDIHIPGSAGMSIDLYRTYSWTDDELRDTGYYATRELVSGVSPLGCANRANYYGQFYSNYCDSSISGITRMGDPIGYISYDIYDFSYVFRYDGISAATGAIRPGGVWRFAVGPEIEIGVVPKYFQSIPNQTQNSFPLAEQSGATVDFIYNAVCGITADPTLNGVRAELPVTLRLPDGRAERLARTVSGSSGVLRSPNNWELRCASPGATRFSLFSPEGTRYDLGQEVRPNAASLVARLLPTKQTHVASSEWIKIDYDTTLSSFVVKPSKVYASDGRVLKLNYDLSYGASISRKTPVPGINSTAEATMSLTVEPVLTAAVTSLGSWIYEYGAPSDNDPVLRPKGSLYFHPSARRALKKVSLPDNGGAWQFEYGQRWNIADTSTRSSPAVGDQRLSRLTESTGGQVTYIFENGAEWTPAGLSGESQMPSAAYLLNCSPLVGSYGSFAPECNEIRTKLLQTATENHRLGKLQRDYRLSKRQTTDGGVWSFAYVKGAAVGQKDITTITRPDGATETLSYFGDWYFPAAVLPTNTIAPPATSNSGWQVGLLVEHAVTPAGATSPIKKTTNDWDKRVYAPGPLWLRSKNWHVDDQYYAPVLKQKTVVSDGVTYTTSYDTTTLTAYGSPTSVVELGPDPSAPSKRIKRTTTIGYYTDTNLWIIDRPQQETVTTAQQ